MSDLMRNPRQSECQICKKSKEVCNLDFSKMENVGIYEGVSIIVLCSEYEERER